MRIIHINRTAAIWLTALALFATGSGARAQGTPPAQIDRTTPHTQKGLTLLTVTRGDAQGQYTFPVPATMDFISGPRSNGPPGGIGLWVRGPKPPPPTLQKRGGMRYFSQPFQNPTASAMALNGDMLPAQVEPVSSYSSYSAPGQQPAPLFLVTIPGGYPAGYPAIDVSLSDMQGHSARWRLTRLAAPYHAIAPPVAVHSIFSGAGIRLTVNAWRDTGPQGSPAFMGMTGVRYAMTAHIPAGSSWTVRVFKRQLEWEAVSAGETAALQARYGQRFARQPLWMGMFGTDPAGPAQDMVPTAYGKYSRYLRLSGELVQTASVTENVTFHNLNIRKSAPPQQAGRFPQSYVPPPSYEIRAKPQTEVTPSGIFISLLPLSDLGQRNGFSGFGQPTSIALLLRFGPGMPAMGPYQQTSLMLPRSPLYRKYHKPVTYSLQAQRPYALQPSFSGYYPQGSGAPAQMVETLQMPYAQPVRTVQNGRVSFQMPPNAMPKHLDTLTLNVLQRAELRSIPISFVVPISSMPPASAFPRAGMGYRR